jgi:hypothetical protein
MQIATKRGPASRQIATAVCIDMMVQLKKFSLCFAKIEDVRNAVEARCVFLRTASPVADISLLRDVADALKHHSPDRPSATVLASTDVATVSMGFGQMRFGEGKFDGAEQVVITKKMATCVD